MIVPAVTKMVIAGAAVLIGEKFRQGMTEVSKNIKEGMIASSENRKVGMIEGMAGFMSKEGAGQDLLKSVGSNGPLVSIFPIHIGPWGSRKRE